MVGDVVGYCCLKSTNTVMGYAGNPEELLKSRWLRIIDVAVDGNGFMVVNTEGTAVAIVEKEDVSRYFFCQVFGDVILPPDLKPDQILAEYIRRITRRGGYGQIIKCMVIAASLHSGQFDDRFLFEKQ